MPCLGLRVRFCSRQLSFVHRLRLGARRVFIGVDPDVDDGTPTAGDPFARFFQRGTNLARLGAPRCPSHRNSRRISRNPRRQAYCPRRRARDHTYRSGRSGSGSSPSCCRSRPMKGRLKRWAVSMSQAGHAERAVAVVAQHFLFRDERTWPPSRTQVPTPSVPSGPDPSSCRLCAARRPSR